MRNKAVIKHLQETDSWLRELHGFYWHRRHGGIPKKQRDRLIATIKRGEKILAALTADLNAHFTHGKAPGSDSKRCKA